MASADTATTTTLDTPPADPVSFSGYVDGSYNHLSGDNVFTSGANARVFDLQRDGFAWQQTGVTLAYQPPKGVGAVVNFTAGHDANLISSFGTTSGDFFDVTQAFAQYAQGPFTIMAGKFVTLAGEEVIAPTGNWNFSRSILFGYAIPFTHTGLRASFVANPKATVDLGVNEGWDNVTDRNSQKTIEAAISLTATDKLTVFVDGYFGKEFVAGPGSAPAGPSGDRSLVDVVATFKLSPKDTLVGNYDIAQQDNASTVDISGANTAKWSGFAGYWNHVVNDKWKVTVRGETFDDNDGYRTGVVQTWTEGTLTLGYTPSADWEFRLEGRGDSSNQASFVDNNGNPKKTLTSYGVEALWKF